MNVALKLIDDFYPHPEELLACALSLPDKDEVYEGYTYKGWRRYEHAGFKQIMESRLSNAVDGPVSIILHSFVVATKGVETTQWIHADLGMGEYAAVLHLHNHPGGTAFWKHKETGDDHITQRMIDAAGADKLAEHLRFQGQSEEWWEMTSLAGAKFNRLAVYPSALFHSRWPKDNMGDTPEEGRITWVAFFNAEAFL